MRAIRRLAQLGFGIQTATMLGAVFLAFSALVLLTRASPDDDLPTRTFGLMMAAALLVPLAASIPAMAWWTIKKGKPSARRWALAASGLDILIAVSGIQAWMHMPHMRTWPFYVLCGITGVLGLIGFWRNQSQVKIRKSARVAGDGTSQSKDYAAQAIAVAIIWVSMDCWSRWATHHELSYPDLIPFLIEMELAVLLTTFGHELGHLVAGWASGKLLRSFQVGPFRWAIRNGVWRFAFDLRKFYGGAVGMVSPDLTRMRSRKAFFVMGGPVASLAMGSIFIVATLVSPGTGWAPYWLFLSMMANFSLSAFVVNLVPLKPESNYSDGAQLMQIVSNGPWARVHFAFAMVAAGLVSRVRPRDYDVDVINRASHAVPTGERGLLLRLFACLHHIDGNRIPEAIASLEEAEALYEQSVFEKPQDICAEFVFVNAFHKRDLAAAEMWWTRMEALPKVERDADYWRARTALLWLRGEREEACEAWGRGNPLARKLPAVGTYDFTRFCFSGLREALDAPVETSPPPLEVAQPEWPEVREALAV